MKIKRNEWPAIVSDLKSKFQIEWNYYFKVFFFFPYTVHSFLQLEASNDSAFSDTTWTKMMENDYITYLVKEGGKNNFHTHLENWNDIDSNYLITGHN